MLIYLFVHCTSLKPIMSTRNLFDSGTKLSIFPGAKELQTLHVAMYLCLFFTEQFLPTIAHLKAAQDSGLFPFNVSSVVVSWGKVSGVQNSGGAFKMKGQDQRKVFLGSPFKGKTETILKQG